MTIHNYRKGEPGCVSVHVNTPLGSGKKGKRRMKRPGVMGTFKELLSFFAESEDVESSDLEKGDVAGHDFHGNQYSSVAGSMSKVKGLSSSHVEFKVKDKLSGRNGKASIRRVNPKSENGKAGYTHELRAFGAGTVHRGAADAVSTMHGLYHVYKGNTVEKGSGTFVSRDLTPGSAGALRGWAEGNGINCNRWGGLSVTMMSCPNTFTFEPDPKTLRCDLTAYSPELVRLDDGSLALKFKSPDLVARFNALVAAGAEWPYGDYVPYVILSEARDGWGQMAIPDVELDTLPAAIFLEGEEIQPDVDEDDVEDTVVVDGGVVENYEKFSMDVVIKAVDEDQRLVYGWATMAEENGVPVVDGEGDVIDVADMQAAAHQFNTDVRMGKMGHQGGQVSELVETMVFTKDLQKALGIDLKKVGWLTCFKVLDDDVWEKVKSGELPAFSIGGRGIRTPVEDDDLDKGDVSGHDFHGNQYSGSAGAHKEAINSLMNGRSVSASNVKAMNDKHLLHVHDIATKQGESTTMKRTASEISHRQIYPTGFA